MPNEELVFHEILHRVLSQVTQLTAAERSCADDEQTNEISFIHLHPIGRRLREGKTVDQTRTHNLNLIPLVTTVFLRFPELRVSPSKSVQRSSSVSREPGGTDVACAQPPVPLLVHDEVASRSHVVHGFTMRSEATGHLERPEAFASIFANCVYTSCAVCKITVTTSSIWRWIHERRSGELWTLESIW